MRITIIATGSRGDVEPYIALAVGLKRRGHAPLVVTTQDFGALVRSHGVDVVEVALDVQAAVQQMSASLESGSTTTSFRAMAAVARRGATLTAEAGMAACVGADAVLAGLGGGFIAAAVAEKLGLPLLRALNVPLTPTSELAGALLPRFPWRGLSHVITRQAVWQASRAAANRARVEVLGLAPAPWFGALDDHPSTTSPVLYGFSPSVIAKPADWGEHVHVTGYWFADEPSDWSPPSALARFLERGPAPVCVGFGSMSSERPADTTRLVLDAVARAGRRAVILSGWAGLGLAAVPDDVFVADLVPHRWLFPRVAAVVHHGGAGTTAAGIRAGVPSIVVPFHGDQPFWAARVAALGVGPAPIPRRSLTSDALRRAIEVATGDQVMEARAAELGRRVRAEDGVLRAIEVIERSL